MAQITIALAGNPNCGKTTLFNALTGSNQYVGNWPGVTVEKKDGRLKGRNDVVIQDLPGIYSLSPYTLEEVVARGYLVNEKPDAILNIVDGTNIERNLYLTTQLMELGIPVVVAVNMIDLVRKNGDTIDLKKLSQALGCPAVEISALKGEGCTAAAQAAINAAQSRRAAPLPPIYTGETARAIESIEALLARPRTGSCAGTPSSCLSGTKRSRPSWPWTAPPQKRWNRSSPPARKPWMTTPRASSPTSATRSSTGWWSRPAPAAAAPAT